jgi:hypothetical protein
VRQDIVDDMRDAFDQLDPDNLPSEVELRLELKRRAWTAVHRTKYSNLRSDPDDIRHVEDSEYHLFEEYLRGLDHAKLARVRPLAYRRLLSTEEVAELWDQLVERWGLEPPPRADWSPFFPPGAGGPGEIFETSALRRSHTSAVLRGIISNSGKEHVWQVPTSSADPALEFEAGRFMPECEWDCFWTPKNIEWLIRFHHEGQAVIVGQPLLNALKERWPEWREGLWTDEVE